MTSPYYIHTLSSKQVIRILKLITHKLLSWSNTKFSQIFYKGMCSSYMEELTITSWELKGWGVFICHTKQEASPCVISKGEWLQMMENYDKFQLHIGNNMISSAIWCCQAWVKFSKKTKLNKSIGQVQLIVFEKFSKSLLFQIAREIMSLLIMYMKKHHRVKTVKILKAYMCYL